MAALGRSKSALRPFRGQIDGAFPNGGVSFQRSLDTAGRTKSRNVQSYLMSRPLGACRA
jgi:hypothetical protein